MPKIRSDKILEAATATGAGKIRTAWTPNLTFEAVGVASGVGAVEVRIEASLVVNPLDDEDFVELGTITLVLLAGKISDGFAIDASWRHIRANVISISGSNAQVDVYMGGSLGGG